MALTIRPHYPRASRAMGEEGAVTLHARFFPDGRASEVRLVKSSGYRRLDESAIEAAQISSASFSARPEAPVEKDFTVVFRLSDPE
jgi:protein TonB